MKTKLIAGLCSAALAASCMGFTAFAEDAQAGSSTSNTLNAFEATSENVKTIGRTYYADDALWMNMSATGVEFTCTGTKVSFNFINNGDPSRTGFYVNGELKAIKLVKNKCSVSLDLAEGENTVKIVKFSEGPQSVLGLDSILVDGDSIAPTAAKAHSIEFIGDSITCGYGVEVALGKDTFATSNENAAKTYAYQTAYAFDADYSFVSASGFGIVSGYTMSGLANETSTMPQYYDTLGFSWSNVGTVGTPQSIDWDFAQYQPELIVLNLGQNDSSYTKGDADKCAEFEALYVDFLKQIRTDNPNSKILCTLGIMGQDLWTSIENAVDTYTAETEDTNVYTMEFSVQDSSTNGYAVDYHPTPASHLFAANELETKINELFGWEVTQTADDGVYTFVDADEKALGEYVDTKTDDSESSSDASSESSSEDNSDSSASSSKAEASTSSKTTATNNTTTSNPNTGAAAGATAAVAIIGATIVVLKKRK